MSKTIYRFLHRRSLFFILLILLSICQAAALSAEDFTSIRFSFGESQKLKITERSNIRVSENGVYKGLTYNESRGVFDYMWNEDGYTQYAGRYYVYEASKHDTRLIANPVDLAEYCEIAISEQGIYKIRDDQLLPVLRSFPVFPAGEVEAGDSWRDYGERLVDPDDSGRYTKVKFYCEYRYEGLKESRTGLKHIITAQYAMRYKPGDSSQSDPDLKKISGSHLVTIMIDDEDRSSIFIRDQLDEQYYYFDGRILEHKGFSLIWYDNIIGIDRGRLARMSRDELEKEEVEDIEIIEKDEGLALNIRNLHFKADSAELLSEDDGRMRSVFNLLSEVGVGKILVVGHTADVGTKESQYLLSRQRAVTVINKLVGLGMNAGMFIYEGRGGDEPVDTNDTAEGRAANRRVELIFLDD